MRAGGCTIQQALTADAANVIKQSVTLARRRGHAQVTPLHVASTMLTSSTGLLRTSCLQSQSHSHPLQCKALELCFNVALNRIPASTSSHMLGGHHQSHFPSISNALVAAFKRAQAHQRRGSIESQKQPLLTVKIELEQLVISILDDPSVSRVMREAGFSSTQVKSNVEQAVSMEICSQSEVISNKEINSKLVLSQSCDPRKSQQNCPLELVSKPRACIGSDRVNDEDVTYVIENMIKLRRNLLVLGECVYTIANVVKEVMDKVEKGDVPNALKDVKLITLSFSSFGHLNRIEIEKEIEEVKGLVKRFICKGVILNLGDLKWASDQYRASSSEQRRGYYCPVEHMIMEIGKLCCGIGESEKFWILGIADSQTYLRCKAGHPSIQTIWGLHTIIIPANSASFLRLSLVSESEEQSESRNGSRWVEGGDGKEKVRSCCSDCLAKFEIENRNLQTRTINSTLPAWLQQYKDETKGFNINNNHKDSIEFNELCKKWSSICNSIHKQPYFSSDITTTLCSISPSSSTSNFSYDHQYPNFHHHIQISETMLEKTTIPYVPKFKELTAENLTTLCNAIEEKIPRQKEIVHDIATTLLKCRSGIVKRKKYDDDDKMVENDDSKEETWFVFQGVDVEAKEKMAHELARLVFGSEDNLVTISLSNFSATRLDSGEIFGQLSRKKRLRENEKSCCYKRFSDEVSRNPHRVFVVEDFERFDYFSQMGFKRAIERGKIVNENGNGKEVGLADAIIILSCERLECDRLDEIEKNRCVSLDLNVCMEDDSMDIDQSIDIGLLELVDRRIIFNF